MMTKLDSSTIQRISSGQLILDIPSTLKELIENSLDAQSTQITLVLEDDGLTSLSVRISLKPAQSSVEITVLVFLPKIDQQFVNGTRPARSRTLPISIGFERMALEEKHWHVFVQLEMLLLLRELKVKLRQEVMSLIMMGRLFRKILFQGVVMAREKACAGQRGTSITVRNLLKRLPVRLEQARKHRLAFSKIKGLIMSYALVKQVRFCLQVRGNKRIDWTVQGSSDAFQVGSLICGKEFMQRYTQQSRSKDGLTINAILPRSGEGGRQAG